MAYLILAESSLELVPEELQSSPSVASHARRLGKKPSEILLDNSWHYEAMRGLDGGLKRGRPDLVHFSILEATSVPLYFEGRVRVFVHTVGDRVIEVGQNVRIPKSYHRFAGLFAGLLLGDGVPARAADGGPLLSVRDQSFSELVDELNPSRTVGLSTAGRPASARELRAALSDDDSCMVVGGFQKGHFSDSVLARLSDLVMIGRVPLEAHVVVARILYEREKTIFM